MGENGVLDVRCCCVVCDMVYEKVVWDVGCGGVWGDVYILVDNYVWYVEILWGMWREEDNYGDVLKISAMA